jgi:hypothetical protein
MEKFILENIYQLVLTAMMTLILYIFKQQSTRLSEIEKICKICPINGMAAIIAEIRTDLRWIKEKLNVL